jgi:predicted ATP-dependent endonuclease of OLD family
MALERIVIHNFQSLKQVDIELGRFTVIVGASSSGKSAFMRAVRALASNVRGSSMITVGEKSMSVTAYTDSNIVTLQRAGAVGKYLVVDRATGIEEKYSKLAQKVPEDVSAALRIQPVTKDQASINFSAQHDLPYLLGDNVSAAQVARVLGDLTNVSTIFEAVREANKKKTATGSLIKTREADFQAVLDQVTEFTRLKDRIGYVEAAESLLDELSDLDGRQQQLQELVASQERSEAVLRSLKVLPEVPSIIDLEDAYNRYQEARQEISSWALKHKSVSKLQADLETARLAENLAHEEFHTKLNELGTCPTCGQEL